jgi:nucleoside-diphosphate-sugar epimerase
MKRVLITGGTGFVGANLARRLLQDGHEVHLLVRSGFNPWRIQSIQSALLLHETPLQDKDALISLVEKIQPNWIFHLAVHGAYSYQTDLDQIVQTNIISTINLVEACLRNGFEAFVNTGSSSEYGFKDHAPSESEWLEPNSYYAVTKASATLFCRYTAQSKVVHIPTLRLYSVYGSYEEPTRLLPTLIRHGLRGSLPPLVNPTIARDFVYIDDVIDAYLLAATQANQELGAVYNVGTGVQTTLSEVVEMARRIMDIAAQPEWGSMPDRHWDASVWIANNQAIKQALGWEAHYSFESGFSAMVNWMRQHLFLYES